MEVTFVTRTYLAIIGCLLSMYFKFSDVEGPPVDIVDQDLRAQYDYIIVGGGSAGCVLANRLSEDENVTVLLLEAGGQETPTSEVPGLVSYLQLSEMDWQYQAEPSSTSCLAMMESRCMLPRGKVVGGSSSINYMLYVRGNRRDYDLWAAQGNPGWSYDDVLPYFMISEDNTNPAYAANEDYHNIGGYQTIGESPWQTTLSEAFLEAGAELGYPTLDCNAATQTGFMVAQGFVRNGLRCSNSKAFLRPVRDRLNLHVALNVFVTKILIEMVTRRAYGVMYDRGPVTQQKVLARREVVISAGAINTPQLLMLSGIGPANHLFQFNIPVIADLPVGRNLQDHIAGGIIFTLEEPVSLLVYRMLSIPALISYLYSGRGPLTSFGGVEGLAFVNSKYGNKTDDWPDIEYHFVSGSHASDGGNHLRLTLGLNNSYWSQYFKPILKTDHFSILAKLLRPRSRGYIELKSSSPYDHPKIVTNYLTETQDLEVIVEGLRIARAIGNTTVFRSFGTELYSQPVPGCENLVYDSPDYWKCTIRHLTYTIYHYCGTAKMGPYWDSQAVVDPQLRVYGVVGLRVVDASIFPNIPSGNTNAPVTMVAEKASDLIKNYWNGIKASKTRTDVLRRGTGRKLKPNVDKPVTEENVRHVDEL